MRPRLFLRVLALGVGALLHPGAPPARAGVEADRLWLVGERAFADRLYTVSQRSLDRFVRVFPDDPRAPEATLLLGKSRFALGHFAAALEEFRKARSFSPPPGRPEEARFWEAESLFRLKRYGEARTVYDALLAANAAAPVAPEAMYGLAWTELELRRPEAAVAAFREFLSAWPDSPLAPSATFYLARTLVELKKPDEAVSVLEPFLARHPDHALAPEARYLLGMGQLASGRIAGGVASLRAFAAARPRHELAEPARRAIVGALLRHGTPSELLEEYRSLLAQSPPTAEGLYDAGTIAAQLERPDDAEVAWRRLQAEFPDHPLAPRGALELAQAAFSRKQFAEAAALARRAAERGEAALRGRALLLMGESELKLKRQQAALKAFHAAAEVPDLDPALRYRALAGSGLAHEELRHWAEAVRLYAEVAAGSPDKALKQWAKDRLAHARARAAPPRKRKTEKPNS